MLLPSRLAERITYADGALCAVLDEALVCHVGVVVDGEPHVLPTMHCRVEDRLYLHASTASRMGLAARSAPMRVCVTVSILDGLVLARSAFHHSLNYRSVVIHADAALVRDDEEKARVLAAFVERAGAGRSDQCRGPNARELAATAVLAVPLTGDGVDTAVKARTGPPVDDEADLALPHWAGVVPVQLVAAAPRPDGDGPVPSGLAPTLAHLDRPAPRDAS
ncbi:pyridoxamine 5'-phosphate oxidase family protein [Frankia canadensis]|nr:pyridoxamine 5'-phosphate oxidase family protein [Frankia canadensis]